MGEADVPIYTFIATPGQLPKGYPEHGAPYDHKVARIEAFFQILEQGLNREVLEYYDPQYAASNSRPNYYIYLVAGDTYYFAVHFQEEFSFTKNVAKNYNKVDLSNNPNDVNLAKDPDQLLNSKEFTELINRSMRKPGFFEEREQKSQRLTKQPR